MRIGTFLIALVSIGLFLAGCQSVEVDNAIKNNLPKICSAGISLHSAFVTIAATGTVKQRVINQEAAAYAGLRAVCADPDSVNSTTALMKAAEAYAAVVAAMREVKKE